MFALVLIILLSPLSIHSEVLSSESYSDYYNLDKPGTNMPDAFPACTIPEMDSFDKFLRKTVKKTDDKWGDNGFGEIQELKDKAVVDRIILIYYDKDDPKSFKLPKDTGYRDTSCSEFAAYCKGTPVGTGTMNKYYDQGQPRG